MMGSASRRCFEQQMHAMSNFDFSTEMILMRISWLARLARGLIPPLPAQRLEAKIASSSLFEPVDVSPSITRDQQGIDAEGPRCDCLALCQTHHQARPGMHSHLRARFGFCNDHIWPLNAFKMFLMFQEVGLCAGSDTMQL